MKFGTAKEIITPPVKTRIACSGEFELPYKTIHDDLYVRILVMDDGKSLAFFAAFDLLFHSPELNDALAGYANGRYGIKPEMTVTGYTHAHTAPAARGYNPGSENDAYEAFLLERAKTCLDRAMCNIFEGTLEYCAYPVSFNVSRRPDMAPNPAREHDTEMALLAVRDLDGTVRCVLMSYACHPVFYPSRSALSSEFPGRIAALLDAKYYGAVTLYFQSAGGDVRPRDTVADGKFISSAPFSVIDNFAREIAENAAGKIDAGDMRKISVQLNGKAGTIELPMDPKSAEFFANESKRMEKETAPWHPNKRNAEMIINGYDKKPLTLKLRTSLIRLGGNVVIAALGGEPCWGVKKIIKETLAGFGLDVIFIGYTDACAYIISDAELAEGGYEAKCHLEYGLVGPFKPGLDEIYRKVFKEYAKELNDNDN